MSNSEIKTIANNFRPNMLKHLARFGWSAILLTAGFMAALSNLTPAHAYSTSGTWQRGAYIWTVSPEPIAGGRADLKFDVTNTQNLYKNDRPPVISDMSLRDLNNCLSTPATVSYAYRKQIVLFGVLAFNAIQDSNGHAIVTFHTTFRPNIDIHSCRFDPQVVVLSSITYTGSGRIGRWTLHYTPYINWSYGGFRVTTPPPAPTFNLTFTPNPVTSGQNFTMTWSSTNATSISGTPSPATCPSIGGFINAALSGGSATISQVVNVYTDCRYDITVAGPGGQQSTRFHLYILPPAPPTFDSFSINPGSVTSGQNFTLSWSTTNTTSISTTTSSGCPDAGGLQVPSGSRTFTAPDVSGKTSCSYTATANGPGGTTSRTVSVTVNPNLPGLPTLTISASPNPVTTGVNGTGSSTISWTQSGATSMSETATGACSGQSGLGASPTGSFTIVSGVGVCTVTVNASNAAGTTSRSVQVTINVGQVATIPTLSLSAPSSVVAGQPFSVSWSQSGATSMSWSASGACSGSGGLSPTSSGSFSVTSNFGVCTVTISASNSAGTTTRSVSVNVASSEHSERIDCFSASNTNITVQNSTTTLTYCLSGLLSGDAARIREVCSFGRSNIYTLPAPIPTANGNQFISFPVGTSQNGSCSYILEIIRSGQVVASQSLAVPVNVVRILTSCGLTICLNYDSRIITYPPPGFTQIVSPLAKELAP